MSHWTSHITVKINGETIARGILRVGGTTSATLANAARMAEAIAPHPDNHHGRCKCDPCVRNRQHQWTILRAVYRWTLVKIAKVTAYDHSTVHHGTAKMSGMAGGFKNTAYVRAVPGKRVRNRIKKLRVATTALRKKWAQETMAMREEASRDAA